MKCVWIYSLSFYILPLFFFISTLCLLSPFTPLKGCCLMAPSSLPLSYSHHMYSLKMSQTHSVALCRLWCVVSLSYTPFFLRMFLVCTHVTMRPKRTQSSPLIQSLADL